MWNIFFIDENPTTLLHLAYKAINGLERTNVNWYKPDQIRKKFKKFEENCSFIFGSFESSLFNYLKDMGMGIFGPQLVLDYLRSDDCLPKTSVPLFSSALKGVLVCFTGFSEEERSKLGEKVLMMHGKVIKDLTVRVNVLVSASVGTKKLRVAAARGINVVLQDWVAEIWKLSSNTDPITTLDKKLLDKHRIPVFYNLKICVSGLTIQEREETKTIITKNGGQYFKDLTVGKCTHLVCKYPSGQKYNYAEKWKVQTVSCKWLSDSVEKGYVLDENDYRLDGKTYISGSTPVTEARKNYDVGMNEFSTLSVSGQIDETIIFDDEESGIDFQSQHTKGIWSDCVIGFIDCEKEFIDHWTTEIVRNGGRYCVTESKIVSEAITHMVVGNPSSLREIEDEMIYVNSDWLQACLDEKTTVEEDRFMVKNITTVPVAINVTDTIDLNNWASMDQYLDKMTDENVQPVVPDPDETVINPDVSFKDVNDVAGLFANCTFFLFDSLTADQIKLATGHITSNFGSIVTNHSEATHHVVPEMMSQPFKALVKSSIDTVTVFYLEMCIQHNSLLSIDSDFMYQPIIIDSKTTDDDGHHILSGCVLSFSGYPMSERKLLKSICNRFGAVVQDQMSRKAIVNKNIMATTHLIIGKPDNKKLPSCKRWHIPAVTKHWIGACLAQKSMVNVSNYILQDDTNMSIMTCSDATNFNETLMTNIDLSVMDNFRSPITKINNKHLQIRNDPTIKNKSFGDLSSPIMQTKYEGRGKIDISMFKTPEISYPRYRKQVEDVSTPDMEKALKSRLALLDIDAENVLDKYLDISLSETNVRPVEEPLKGVTIFLAESVQAQRFRMAAIIDNLGGECAKIYNPQTVTHVVCGTEKSSYGSEELQKAQLDGKILVSFDWVLECHKQKKSVRPIGYLVDVMGTADLSAISTEAENSNRDCSVSRKRKANEELSEIGNTVETRSPPIKRRPTIDKSIVKSETVLWSYSEHSRDRTENQSSRGCRKVVMLSGVDKDQRDFYRAEIEKLGAAFSSAEEISNEVTHLICVEPGRNPKYLSAIAAGKWVMHDSYLKESIRVGRWLDDCLFEWGGPKTSEFIASSSRCLNAHELSLAAAAKYRRESGGQAFKDWRVCIFDKPDKVEKFSAIIKCGGGLVIPFQSPRQNDITHILINKNHRPHVTDFSQFPCYKIEYISYFLACRNDSEVKKTAKKFLIDSLDTIREAGAGEGERSTGKPGASKQR